MPYGGKLYSGLSRLGASAVGHDRFERRVVGRQQLRQRQSSVGPNRQALPGRNDPEPVLIRHRRERKSDFWDLRRQRPQGRPGALKASTASFATKTGWNTAKVVTPVSLPAGSYWLAYLPSSNALGFLKTNVTGNCAYYSYKFGSLPSKFSTSPVSCNPTTWSFYATLTASSSGTSSVNGACGSSNGEPRQRADHQPLQRRRGVRRERQRAVDLDLRRRQWRLHCGVRGAFIRRRQRRMRPSERRRRQHRADHQPLHRRHGLGSQRQRPVVVDLRREQRRQHRVVLG